ncbi:hypothetical protein [Nostoc piscinale]|uniref:hypothetical protein n=1 Tax=Nostoc piscinale TaxID=224012 RepID=UPI000AE426B3|nr:hypothetical protein [Nostoc piscinale]
MPSSALFAKPLSKNPKLSYSSPRLCASARKNLPFHNTQRKKFPDTSTSKPQLSPSEHQPSSKKAEILPSEHQPSSKKVETSSSEHQPSSKKPETSPSEHQPLSKKPETSPSELQRSLLELHFYPVLNVSLFP